MEKKLHINYIFCNLWDWKRYGKQFVLLEIYFVDSIFEITILNFVFAIEYWRE